MAKSEVPLLRCSLFRNLWRPVISQRLVKFRAHAVSNVSIWSVTIVDMKGNILPSRTCSRDFDNKFITSCIFLLSIKTSTILRIEILVEKPNKLILQLTPFGLPTGTKEDLKSGNRPSTFMVTAPTKVKGD